MGLFIFLSFHNNQQHAVLIFINLCVIVKTEEKKNVEKNIFTTLFPLFRFEGSFKSQQNCFA